MKRVTLFFLLLAGCGLAGDSTRSRDTVRRSEVGYQEVAVGLEGAVRIDSLEWLPFLPFPGSGGIFEVEGAFAAIFNNSAADSVQVRYDLRFFDDEDSLVDAFIPFGQPVLLAAGERRIVQGEFLVRTDDAIQASRLELLRLVARVRRVE
ncbi:MAG: hypothetical protein ACI906_002369 [Candidatus Latescibacterota bacterium]|jgi:hypothetical protein